MSDPDPRPVLVCTPCTVPAGLPATRSRCVRCRQPIWIAKVQVFDVPNDAQPTCIPCCLNDEWFLANERPEMIAGLRARIGL